MPRPSPWRWAGVGAAGLLGVLALVVLLRDPFGWFAIAVAQCRLEPGQVGLQQAMQEAVAKEAVLRTELARLTADAGRRRLSCPPVLARPVASAAGASSRAAAAPAECRCAAGGATRGAQR